MIAAKFFEDQPCDNGYFATVGGVSIQEINAMELTFLGLLEYRVSVTGIEYNLYAQVMEAKADYLEKPRQHYLKEVCFFPFILFLFNVYERSFINDFLTGYCSRHKCCLLGFSYEKFASQPSSFHPRILLITSLDYH